VAVSAVIQHFKKLGVTPTFDNVQYDFFFYCPVSYMMKPFLQDVLYILYVALISRLLHQVLNPAEQDLCGSDYGRIKNLSNLCSC